MMKGCVSRVWLSVVSVSECSKLVSEICVVKLCVKLKINKHH